MNQDSWDRLYFVEFKYQKMTLFCNLPRMAFYKLIKFIRYGTSGLQGNT